MNEYCGSNPYAQSVGVCKKFEKAGKDCMPITSGTDLANNAIADDIKCAVTSSGNPATPNTLVVEYVGACMAGTCRMCAPNSGSSCGANSLNKPRSCVWPGVWETPHSANWNSGRYYEDPIRVWLAVFFVFFFISFVMNVIMFLSKILGLFKKK
jgi:hypothetical protein